MGNPAHSIRRAFEVGEVVSTNPDLVTVKVQFPDLDNVISNDLQILNRRAFGDRDYDMPDIGELVVCAFLGNGIERGFILGSLYSLLDLPPVKDQNKRHTSFRDGTWLEYDRAQHKLSGHVVGDVDLRADGDIRLVAGGNLYLQANGEVYINGKLVKLNC
ncbi:MAG: phage baseplate assembly protein V [Planctomycetaceae bacterium]|nr:phage baseplate assembly protein V [Planctomycetaceae bacterium]